jgi:hypothetical protein
MKTLQLGPSLAQATLYISAIGSADAGFQVLVARGPCLAGCSDGPTLWSITLTEFRACDDRFGDVDPEMVFVIEPAQRWQSK